MKKIRFLTGVIASMLLISGLAACGSKVSDEGTGHSIQTADNVAENNKGEAADVAEPYEAGTDTSEAGADSGEKTDQTQIESGKDTLVVVFSATGTTKGVAEKIVAITDADLYEIIPAEPYSDADLDWHDKNSRTTIEQDDPSVRPDIGSETISLEGYKTIYIGERVIIGTSQGKAA